MQMYTTKYSLPKASKFSIFFQVIIAPNKLAKRGMILQLTIQDVTDNFDPRNAASKLCLGHQK